MRWPDIFFKAKPLPRPEEPVVSAPVSAESPSPPSIPLKPATKEIKPPQPTLKSPSTLRIASANPPASSTQPELPQPRILPGAGGVVMRAPARATASSSAQPVPSMVVPPPPAVDVKQAMDEADTLRVLTRSGGVRLIKRGALPPESKAETIPVPEPPTPAPPISEQPGKESLPLELPVVPAADVPRVPEPTSLAEKPAPTPPVAPAAPIISRRKTSMANIARIVAPPKREEPAPSVPEAAAPSPSESEPPQANAPPVIAIAPPEEKPAPKSEPSEAVVPPAIPTGDVLSPEKSETPKGPTESIHDTLSSEEKFVPVFEPNEPVVVISPDIEGLPLENPSPVKETPPLKSVESTPVTSPSEEKSDNASVAPAPESTVAPAAGKDTTRLPKTALPSGDPKTEPIAVPVSVEQTPSARRAPKNVREFLLTNGERILGHILSETPEAIYLNHDTLGVLTIPRAQIAKNLVEVILINGDRIIGDIVAETPESLVVRHASLGMLTIPHVHRSKQVVEAILKDGDRILGEVLAETENFTVIRSATLGTVAVQHSQVAMLNRRVEQIQLKTLLAPPAIEDKPAA